MLDLARVSALFLTVIASTSLAAPSAPPEYKFYRGLRLALGVGFTPGNVQHEYRACIDAPSPTAVSGGALDTRSEVFLVANDEQLIQVLGVDINAEASAFGGEVKAGHRRDESATREARMLRFVFRAHTEYGEHELDRKAQLFPFAKQLITDDKHAAFAAMCGTHYIARERRGATVAAVVDIASTKASTVVKLRSTLNAGGGWGPVSASLRGTVNNELTRAAKNQQISIKVWATGGPGFGDTGGLVKAIAAAESPDAQIFAALGEYIAKFHDKNPARISMRTASFRNFGFDPAKINAALDLHDSRTRAISEQYSLTRDWESEAVQISKGSGAVGRYAAELGLQVKKIESAMPAVKGKLEELAKAQKECTVEKCFVPAGLPEEIVQLIPAVARDQAPRWVIDTDRGGLGPGQILVAMQNSAGWGFGQALRPGSPPQWETDEHYFALRALASQALKDTHGTWAVVYLKFHRS